MKKILILFLLCQNILLAQKKNFTMQEAVSGLSSTLAVKNMQQLKWTGSSEIYAFIQSNDTENVIMTVNPTTFVNEPLITLEKMNSLLEKNNFKKQEKFPVIQWVTHNTFYCVIDNKYIQFIVTSKDNTEFSVINELPKDVENITKSNKQMDFVYRQKNNLFLKTAKANAVQITTDGTENLMYGTSVHRDEFGIHEGLFWSPFNDAIAFYKMDQSMVQDYPIINWNETPAKVNQIKYPFAGKNSHHVTLGIYHIATAKTIYIKTGEPKDQYLTSVTWSPDNKTIYIGLLNRDQNFLQLNQYDASTGEFLKTLFTEKSDKYVEPQHQLYFMNNDDQKFIWMSQRDGYMHMYLYTKNGALIQQLTKGEWIVNEIIGFNNISNEIIFSATKESPLQKNIYAVHIESAIVRKITKTPATHNATASTNCNYIIDIYNNEKIPRNIEILSLNTLVEKRILTASNPIQNYNTSKVIPITLLTDDKTTLYSKIMLPYNFDTNKKYPVIVYLYIGPHLQLVKETFPPSGNLWYDYLTQNGYIVFVMDGRGSSNRGLKFENATFKKLGEIEMQDQLKGISYLKSLAYIDSNRLGLHGWSYGGFMTTSLMLHHPNVFKCGVAGGPVLDWNMYEVMYTERYMDTPEQNKEGYEKTALFDKIKNLKGKLLMIHGTDDDVVVWQHSLKMLKKSVDQGVQLDYYVYPSHAHNVRGKDRIHLMQKITDYFNNNL